MQVTQTQQNSLTGKADGRCSTTIIPNCYIFRKNIFNSGDVVMKPIPDFDGYYANSDGKIFSDLGKGNRRNNRKVELYEVKPRMGKNGYMRVYIRNTKTNKRQDRYVHRIIANLFLPNPLNKKYVNHKNCNRTDNRVENLEWCTIKENNQFTIEQRHLIRGKDGKYIGNFDYTKLI